MKILVYFSDTLANFIFEDWPLRDVPADQGRGHREKETLLFLCGKVSCLFHIDL